MHRTIVTQEDRIFAHALGAVLEERRRALGLTKAELVRRMGVAESTILGWEDGRMIPHVSALRRLAVELDTTATKLLRAAEYRAAHPPAPAGENG